jgi:hypothetical protein
MIDYMASAGPHISVKVDEVFNAAGNGVGQVFRRDSLRQPR